MTGKSSRRSAASSSSSLRGPEIDESVGLGRPGKAGVAAVSGRERLDKDAVACRSGRCGEAPKRLGEQGVAGDLIGGLPEDEPERQARTRRELARRGMRVISEARRGFDDPASGRRSDLDVGPIVQDERDRSSRDTGHGRDVGTRGSPGFHQPRKLPSR